MKKPTIVVRILVVLLEIIFLGAFMISATLTPMVQSANEIVNGDIIKTAVENIELGDLLYDSLKEGLDEETANEFKAYFNTDFANEVLTSYTENVIKALKGEEYTEVDSNYVSQVFDKHSEEMYELFFELNPEYKNVNSAKKEFKNTICSIFEILPSVNEIIESYELDDTIGTLSYIGSVNTIMVIVTLILAILIVVISLYRGNGFVWLAVDLFIPMITSLVIGFMDASVLLQTLGMEMEISESVMGIVSQFVSGLTSSFRNYGLIYLVVFVLSIILKIIMVKKQNKIEDENCESQYEYM